MPPSVLRSLVVATGGLSIPKIGATSFGYDLARQFGLKIVSCRAALVPLLFDAEDRQNFGELAGISTEVIASSDGQQFREKMLFTHRGLSGPGYSADFFLLEAGRGDHARLGAGDRADARDA